MTKYRKKAQKAIKTGKDPPPKPPKIVIPPQNLPDPNAQADARERMEKQPPGQTHAYLLSEPTYVHFHTTPLPPPEPAKGKKGKKGKVRHHQTLEPSPASSLWPSLTFHDLL